MSELLIRHPGLVDFTDTWQAMRQFTEQRTPETADELWILQHPAVFTLGQAGRREHLLDPGTIPVVATDRGGQVTYHAPGQWVVYPLLDLRRRGWHVRDLVDRLEDILIATLADFSLRGERRAHAPGIYIAGRKIGSLGLRIRRGCSYHGLSLNVAMDMQPWQRIHPCGMADLSMTSLAEASDGHGDDTLMAATEAALLRHFQRALL